MDGGASSPATATPSESDTISCGNRFDWKFERLRPSRAHPEADGTDSPPHHPFSDSAEILRISGRGICKEAIFSPGGQAPRSEKISTRGDQPKSSISLGRSRSDLLALWASNLSAAQVAGLDWKSRGFTPSRALRGCSGGNIGFRRCRLSFWGHCFRRRGRGALRFLTPDGVREGCDPLALSRGCSGGDIGSRRCRLSFGGHCFRRGRLFS